MQWVLERVDESCDVKSLWEEEPKTTKNAWPIDNIALEFER